MFIFIFIFIFIFFFFLLLLLLFRYLFIYHLFGLYWTANLIEAIGLMVVAGSVTTWYFTPEIAVADQTEVQQARYDVGGKLFWKIKFEAGG